MSNSSPQDLYSITLDDSTSTDIITITSTDHNSYDTMISGNLNYDVGNITIDICDSITFNSTDTISTDYLTGIQGSLFNQEWVDTFPDWHKVKDMCDRYPSLEIAVRNLKTVYDLIKDDYDSQKNQDSNT